MRLRIIVLLIALSSSAFSQAATVSVLLPSLEGIYSTSNTYPTSRVDAFNLGVQFSSITSVLLELTGISTPGSARTCDASLGVCVVSPFNPKMGTMLLTSDIPSAILGSSSFDFDTKSSISVPIWSTSWAAGFLNPGFLSGNGRLALSSSSPADVGFILTDATIDVSNVKLTVEGTVVPIPAALPLLVSGLTGLLFFQRKRKLA